MASHPAGQDSAGHKMLASAANTWPIEAPALGSVPQITAGQGHYDLVDVSGDMAKAGPGSTRFMEVASPQLLPPPSPLFLLGCVTGQILQELFGHLQIGGVGCYTIAAGRISPDGVLHSGQHAFYSPSIDQPRHWVRERIGRPDHPSVPVREIRDSLVLLCRPDRRDEVHWLSEIMPRLWVLAGCGHDLTTLRYLVPHELPSAVHDMLALAGIGADQLEAYGRDRVMMGADVVLVPTGLRRENRMSPLLATSMKFWTEAVRTPAAPSATADRLFIDAPDDTAMANVDDIRRIARQRGYIPVRLQAMSLAEQVATLGSAGRIVGGHAVTLHACLLARPGTLICDLRPPLQSLTFLQSSTAQVLGQRIGYVFGRLSDTPAPGGTPGHTIEPAMFESALDVMDLHGVPAGPTAS